MWKLYCDECGQEITGANHFEIRSCQNGRRQSKQHFCNDCMLYNSSKENSLLKVLSNRNTKEL